MDIRTGASRVDPLGGARPPPAPPHNNVQPEAIEGREVRRPKPFRLVQLKQPVSHDTVRCLRALLEEAERGEIQGLSFAVMKSNREFTYNFCGEAHRNPAWAAAMAVTLLHGTMKRVFNEEGA
jgi:hypothetical protein